MPGAIHVDDGVIRCICGFDHDDGFTIQCESCNAWQHAVCVDIFDSKSVPEIYLCSECSDRPVDPAAATERQLNRLSRRAKSSRKPQDWSAEQPAAVQKNGSAAREPKKRGRKRRSEETEVADEFKGETPQHFFAPCTKNTFTAAAQDYTQKLTTMDTIIYLSKPEYERAKPASVSIQRRDSGFSATSYSVVANVGLSKDRFVLEFRGEVMTREEYKSDPINQYMLFGCTKPGAIFVPSLKLAIDGRRIGTEANFLRRSRTPNLRFSPVLVDGELHVVAFANQSIKAGTELTIPWDWDVDHPVQKLRDLDESNLDPSEQQCLKSTALALLNAGYAFSSLEEFLSPLESVTAIKAPKMAVKRPVRIVPSRRDYWLRRFIKQTVQPTLFDEDDTIMIPQKNLWAECPQRDTLVTAPVKKRLSLADYKKKHA